MSEVDETTAGLLSEEAWEAVSKELKLSGRERTIVRLCCDGQKEASIATALGVSHHTVHTHLDRAYRKLQLSNRTQLVNKVFATYLRLVRDMKSTLPPICANCDAGFCPHNGKRVSEAELQAAQCGNKSPTA